MTAQLLSLFLAFLSTLSASGANLAEPTALGQYLALVNHEYTLSSDYEPDDLIKPSVRNDSGAILMREEAAHALEDLFASADADGMHLIATSGYRSYDTQELIYKRKIKNTGSVEKANLLVAIPGTSEHQLGLAMDLKCKTVQNLHPSFANSKEGQWLAEHAHEFGFIIRYKKEWTDITGYSYEPWHIRYVGKEHAQIIHELDIPLEEYISTLRLIAEDEYLKGNQ